MAESHLPLILIEVVLVFGGALAFGWWQLRQVRRDAEQAEREKQARAKATEPGEPPA